MSRGQREALACVLFIVLWCGGWPVGYVATGDTEYLWIGPVSLAGSGLILGVMSAVDWWIERGG